ncbi:iron ABC transporter permease [Leptotrichia sp. OH3620_COT-345]|uniref:FecCD family ABC transporter permease n=1 Tax=Leptotrichia sp. OH3620_COT-345 TaxID=2491048 RepID=UPI000F6522B4|nr:iron ABC transporter permease [Leptotrichia sp. OH3620_COT-345]RRD40420.1 iron ABC transporter permease [Leptotrichia sp. OH3620_COT-345]
MNSNINMKKIYAGLLIFLLIFIFMALYLGDIKVSFKDAVNILLNRKIEDESLRTIILNVRLPRIIMAILIGMLLSCSGTVVQTVFQNPLADPYIIGISASATFGAVIAFMLGMPDIMYGILGFIASVIVALIIFRLSNQKTRTDIASLLIIGIAVSSFLGAFTSFSMYLIGQDSFKIIAWMMGYIGNASWTKVFILLFPLGLSVIYFYLKRYDLDLLLSGDEEAHSLGADIGKLKKNMLIVSSFIIGFSVAFTGMIGFVGLIAPHTVRLLTKSSSNTKLIPLATLGGGIFLLVCDTIGRTLLSPVEVPIGVVTAFFGAPFFLYLAMKKKKVG